MGLRQRGNNAVCAVAAQVHRWHFGDMGRRTECKGESRRSTQGFLTFSWSSGLRSRRRRSGESVNSTATARFKGYGGAAASSMGGAALGRDSKVAVRGQALFMGAWGNVGSMPRRGVAKAESVVSVVFVPDTSRGRT